MHNFYLPLFKPYGYGKLIEVNSEYQSLKEVQELSCPLLLNVRSLGQQKQHYLETYKKMYNSCLHPISTQPESV